MTRVANRSKWPIFFSSLSFALRIYSCYVYYGYITWEYRPFLLQINKSYFTLSLIFVWSKRIVFESIDTSLTVARGDYVFIESVRRRFKKTLQYTMYIRIDNTVAVCSNTY